MNRKFPRGPDGHFFKLSPCAACGSIVHLIGVDKSKRSRWACYCHRVTYLDGDPKPSPSQENAMNAGLLDIRDDMQTCLARGTPPSSDDLIRWSARLAEITHPLRTTHFIPFQPMMVDLRTSQNAPLTVTADPRDVIATCTWMLERHEAEVKADVTLRTQLRRRAEGVS